MSLMPLARSAQSREEAASMRRYARSLEGAIVDMAPWTERGGKRSRPHPKAKPGEAVVIFEDGDNPKDPLYKGAKVVR